MSAESLVKKVHFSLVKMIDAPDQKQAWKRANRLIEERSVTYPDLSAWLEETIAGALAVFAIPEVVFTAASPAL